MAEMKGKWYLGAMNDGLFIIDRPPQPAPTDYFCDVDHGVNVIAAMGNDRVRAEQIIAAHNEAIEVEQTRSEQAEAQRDENLRLAKAISSARDELSLRAETAEALLQIANTDKACHGDGDCQLYENDGRNAGLFEAMSVILKQARNWKTITSSPMEEAATERAEAAQQLAVIVRSLIAEDAIHEYLVDAPEGPCVVCNHQRLWMMHPENDPRPSETTEGTQ